jgi:ribonuclease P protein component
MASGGVDRLRRRADYLRVQAANRRVALPGLLLQAASQNPPPGSDPDKPTGPALRIGFTASRKVGNAVLRNRARRRLKALAADVMPRHAQPGHDYVLVARQATPARDFSALRGDLEAALKKLRLWRPGLPEGGEAGAAS